MKATLGNCFTLCAGRDTCSPPRNLTVMSSPLRMRLTLWYAGTLSVVLILFSLGVYFFVQRILTERIDANLRATLQSTVSVLTRDAKEATPLTEALDEPRFTGQIVAVVDA